MPDRRSVYLAALQTRLRDRGDTGDKQAQAISGVLPYLEHVLASEDDSLQRMSRTARTRYLRGLATNKIGDTVRPDNLAAELLLRPQQSALSGAGYGALLGGLLGYGSGRLSGQTGVRSLGTGVAGAALTAPVVAYLNYKDRQGRNEEIRDKMVEDEDARVFDVDHGSASDALTGGWLNRFMNF